MPRIRSIHPGLFTDEAFVSVSDAAQIFYIGLLTEADDQGVFEWKPVTLKMRLRPASLSPVDGLLAELEEVQRIVHYEIAGRQYGAIRNFRKFQRPKSPNALHPITEHIRIYVGLSPSISEMPLAQPPLIPPNGEISPQMEEVGCRREERKSSEANASGGKPPPDDPIKALFDRGTAILGEKSRSLLGKARKEHGDLAVLNAISRCEDEHPSDPAAFFIKALAASDRRNGGFSVGV